MSKEDLPSFEDTTEDLPSFEDTTEEQNPFATFGAETVNEALMNAPAKFSDAINAYIEKGRRVNPYSSLAGKTFGAVAPLIALPQVAGPARLAKMLGSANAATMATTGAAYGGLASALQRNSDFIDVGTGIAGGGLLGAGMGKLIGSGQGIYEMPFKKIDATADVKKGVQRVSELAREYGIKGNYQEILQQLRVKLEQEGQNIGNTVNKLEDRISGSDIMGIAENAASMKLGSTKDRKNILNFIDDEIENMTPESLVLDRAKYASENSKYNDQIAAAEKELAGIDKYSPEYLQAREELTSLPYGSTEYNAALIRNKKALSEVYSPEYLQAVARQNEQLSGQGRLFEPPKTENYQETVQVPFLNRPSGDPDVRYSEVIGGDFTPQQSEMGTFKFSEPPLAWRPKFWETDPRSGVQRPYASRPRYGTTKLIQNDTAEGQILSEMVGPSLPNPNGLPVGLVNNYSQRPRLVNKIIRTTEEVPLPSKSARDVGDQLFMSGPSFNKTLEAPQPIDDKIFSFSDLFDLKKSVAKKGYSGVPDATTGAVSPVSKKQVSEIEQAMYQKIKDQAKKELSQQEANSLSESIEKYSQIKKNKGGFKKLEKLAENEAGQPSWGLGNIELNRPMSYFNLWPNKLTPSAARMQTGTGQMLMKADKNPWILRATPRIAPSFMIGGENE